MNAWFKEYAEALRSAPPSDRPESDDERERRNAAAAAARAELHKLRGPYAD